MVKAGRAAARDPRAPRAEEQAVRGLGNPPQLLGHMGSAVAGAIGSFTYGLREAFRSPASWWRSINPLGQPARNTVSKRLPVLELPLRIDRFPWLDLDDPATFNQSPTQIHILQGIANARASGLRVDDFDKARYTLYSDTYDERYIKNGRKDTFFDAQEYPEVYGWEDTACEDDTHATDGLSSGNIRAGTAPKTPPQKPLNQPKRRDAPKKLTYDEWIVRERAFHDSLWAINGFYEPIPADTIFIAQDKLGRNILAVFPNGLEVAYGHEEAERYKANTTYNLREYARSQPPPAVEDCRHIHHAWWVEKNPHLQPPDGRCGVLHWGTWPELGKKKGAIWSRDTIKGGTRSNPQDGAYAMRYRMETMKSLGPLTKAIDLLFQVVDKCTRNAYHAAFDLLSPGARIHSTENANEELFPLRAILINSLTEEHVDSGDWKGGWAWLGIFGKFTGGDFCLSQLGIRVPMPAGSIVGIRGSLLKHFVAPWEGYRYSVVHFFKESLRQRPQKEVKHMQDRIDPKGNVPNPSEKAKWRQRARNRHKTRAREIRKLVAYDHVKPEEWHTAQEP
ncbi:MAG: hypothetical protein M1839_009419 [Geoglossum umbratile]|nr:MAG: hypothetical protein M1839_009419 [Geoglossum umbratile]